MNIALVSGLIILILLVIMLIAGVPIAVALGVSVRPLPSCPLLDLGRKSPLLPARSAFSPVFPCSACWQSRSLSSPAMF